MKELAVVLLVTNLIAIMLSVRFLKKALSIIPKYITDEDNYLTEIAKKGGILFLGDSLIQLYDTNAFFSGMLVHNRGVSGNTTAQVIERLASSVYPIRPERLFLLAGTNDLNNKVTPQGVADNIAKICALLKENTPKTKLAVISLLPINPKSKKLARLIVGKRSNEDISQTNSLIAEYCSKNQVAYIDAHSHFCDTAGNLSSKYSLDGLHINFVGYKKLTELISIHLR